MDLKANVTEACLLQHVCRQLHEITHIAESLTLRILDVERRCQMLEESVQQVSVATESGDLHELLDVVGGRLTDLREILQVDQAEIAPAAPNVIQSDHASDDAADQLIEFQEPETIYVDDPQIDLLSA
tara:strand:+ start:238 stop:621 length:384 start_codon:yes stop_codon:yes gene_type:complete